MLAVLLAIAATAFAQEDEPDYTFVYFHEGGIPDFYDAANDVFEETSFTQLFGSPQIHFVSLEVSQEWYLGFNTISVQVGDGLFPLSEGLYIAGVLATDTTALINDLRGNDCMEILADSLPLTIFTLSCDSYITFDIVSEDTTAGFYISKAASE